MTVCQTCSVLLKTCRRCGAVLEHVHFTNEPPAWWHTRPERIEELNALVSEDTTENAREANDSTDEGRSR